MVFDPGTFQNGVGFEPSPVVGILDSEFDPDPFGSAALDQQVRSGGFDIFNPLATEQQITTEYEIPSVLSIRKGQKILAATDHFILGSFNESDTERMSFVFTFGDPVLFGGMGRRPRIYSYSGFLKDSLLGGRGISGWWEMYNKYLRGTRCRALGAIADFRFRDQWRMGYLVAANMAYEESRPQIAPFSFSMFIIESVP